MLVDDSLVALRALSPLLNRSVNWKMGFRGREWNNLSSDGCTRFFRILPRRFPASHCRGGAEAGRVADGSIRKQSRPVVRREPGVNCCSSRLTS